MNSGHIANAFTLAAILNYCIIDIKKTAANSRFAKAGALRFYENLAIYSNFVDLIKFGFENPHLRQAQKRYASPYETTVLTSNRQKKMNINTYKTEKPAAHLAHLVLPDTQADPSQNQKS